VATLTITPVEPDPLLDGFPLSHPYIEHVYAGVVGPTSVLVLRRADLLFRAFPQGIEIDAEEFAQSFGLGPATTPHSKLWRTFDRLHRFGLAEWSTDTGVLEVPLRARPVRPEHLRRLPASTQAVHRSLLSSMPPRVQPSSPAPALSVEEPRATPKPARPSLGIA
jgi:hypothetical protein